MLPWLIPKGRPLWSPTPNGTLLQALIIAARYGSLLQQIITYAIPYSKVHVLLM